MSDTEQAQTPKIERVKKRPMSKKQLESLAKGRQSRIKNIKVKKVKELATTDDEEISRILEEIVLNKKSKPKKQTTPELPTIPDSPVEEPEEDTPIEPLPEPEETEVDEPLPTPTPSPPPKPKPKKEKKPKAKAKSRMVIPNFNIQEEDVRPPPQNYQQLPQPVPISRFISAQQARQAFRQTNQLPSVDIFRN